MVCDDRGWSSALLNDNNLILGNKDLSKDGAFVKPLKELKQMNVAKCRLSEGELNLINLQVAQGLVPVGVDLAARVFQVCYYDLDKR